ncbi:hypothetical protein EV644_103187 [Kribbella orskensis]|uniref:DUF3800 domain-containing protein n=1 Tax=Kribbella orskensis TaxID=2512216 RepID=A0ABY2BPC8_9ACTN|nr:MULTISPECIES: hypothetical protein [Kribbella]TCN39729.1 hypothetical protein EV642_106233 [Kribbella sp. VKM Ac-2500]TCO27488.1 hypothetical protein EV644_103187 [Kribbella orskensis]
MASHAYVDESSRSGYLLCAVVILPADVTAIRRTLRTLCKPGQRRVHMKHESDGRRREILSAVSQLDAQTLVYRAVLNGRSERRAQDECFRTMVPDLLEKFAVGRMVVESCDQDHQDNQVIREVLSDRPAGHRLTYLHSAPASEPLLWLPDIMAWAVGRGGDWKRRCGQGLLDVRDVGP